MVDTQRTAHFRGRRYRASQGLVGLLFQAIWAPRGLCPVLSQLVIHIGGCSHRDPLRINFRVTPVVGAQLVYPHRQIVHDPDLHARIQSHLLSLAQLPVAKPLQPFEEFASLPQLAVAFFKLGSIWGLPLFRQL